MAQSEVRIKLFVQKFKTQIIQFSIDSQIKYFWQIINDSLFVSVSSKGKMKFIGSNSWHDTKDFINLISVFFPLSLSTIILSYDPFLRWCFYIFRLCEAECSTIKFRLSLEIFSSHRTSFYWKINSFVFRKISFDNQ